MWGVMSPLIAPPAPTHYRNSSTINAVLPECSEQLLKYIQLGVVEEIHESPYSCHPLLAVVKDGCSTRMCLDLSRNFNDFIEPIHFNLQAIHTAIEISTPNCYYGKLDLSSCFLTFPLSKDFARWMTFALKGKFYRFNNMPFGLSSAPRIASLLLDVVSSVLYEKGVRHTRYLDDFLFVGATPEAVTLSLVIACQVFESFGLMLNTKKIEGPSQQITFLGLLLDSVAQTVSLPASKKADIKILISSILAKERVSSRSLRTLMGKLSFLSSVLPAARPFMRQCIEAASNPYFSRPRRLSNSFRQELQFWLDNLDVWDGTRKWMLSAEPFVFASDASTEGFGFVVESVPPHMSPLPPFVTPGYAVAGVWSNADAAQYSHRQIGYGEMFSPVVAALIAGPALANSHVIFVLDNSADIAIINKRSSKSPRILSLLKALCVSSMMHSYSFTAVHRPGVANVLPDILSRPSKHKFQLDTESVNALVDLDLSAFPSSPPSGFSSETPSKPLHGSFFFKDHITHTRANKALHHANSIVFSSSATVRSLVRTSNPWATAYGL